MSIKAMMHVWQHSKQRGSALVVMLALADMANDDGECYPGKAKLAEKCRLNHIRNLDVILQKCEQAGELIIIRRKVGTFNKTNLYILTMGQEVTITRSGGNDHRIGRGDDLQIGRVTITGSPDPLFKQEHDPSEKQPTLTPILEILKKRGDLPQ